MGVYASDEGRDFTPEPIPAGMQHGVCLGVYEIGTHINPTYGNEQKQLIISWELPDFTFEKDDGSVFPRTISRFYTQNLGDRAHLRKDLENWRGKKFTDKELKKFNVCSLIGVNCLLQLAPQDNSDYSKVVGVAPLMKGMDIQDPVRDTKCFSIKDDLDDTVPGWIQKLVKKSLEYRGRPTEEEENEYADQPHLQNPPEDDDLPF